MNRLRGPARYGRPRAARPPSSEPPPELRIPRAEPADLDPARPEGAEDPGANVESEDEDELVEPPVDAGVADASIPCRAQQALDEARSRGRDPPVARGGHVSALVALLITAVLSIRFSFTNVATYTVLEFVGSSLPGWPDSNQVRHVRARVCGVPRCPPTVRSNSRVSSTGRHNLPSLHDPPLGPSDRQARTRTRSRAH